MLTRNWKITILHSHFTDNLLHQNLRHLIKIKPGAIICKQYSDDTLRSLLLNYSSQVDNILKLMTQCTKLSSLIGTKINKPSKRRWELMGCGLQTISSITQADEGKARQLLTKPMTWSHEVTEICWIITSLIWFAALSPARVASSKYNRAFNSWPSEKKASPCSYWALLWPRSAAHFIHFLARRWLCTNPSPNL